MAVTLSNYLFDGLFTKMSGLENASGVYAVFTQSGGEWKMLDVEAAADVRAGAETSARRDCWERNSGGKLGFAAYYCKEGTRRRAADEVRRDYDPPCGG